MKTKSELLKEANDNFPEYWKFISEVNPASKLPVCNTFPTILSMTVGEITHRYGTEASFILEVKIEDGSILQVDGLSFLNDNDSDCQFSAGLSKELKQFLEVFSSNLIFNLMCEDGIELATWQDIPD